jgi:phosphoribosylformylglycinamidine cyclo-ligase
VVNYEGGAGKIAVAQDENGTSGNENRKELNRRAYAAAGVDLGAAHEALTLIREHVKSTHGPRVLGEPGFFGGLFQLEEDQRFALVSSADGVGTKLKLASLLDRHDTIGVDLVNHCINDILTCGAQPLFFLDYFASNLLKPNQLEQVVRGLAAACREAGVALLGGETAELPDTYLPGEYDLVGFIVGMVERDSIIDGSRITRGDSIIGLLSSGLHTNGYSLVRRVFEVGVGGDPDEERGRLDETYPELGRTLGDELLETHRSYYPRLRSNLSAIKGMAHITGGGIYDNVSRPLPQGLSARFELGSWPVPPIFPLIQQRGNIAGDEMYHVFNMGLGMVLFCAPDDASSLLAALPEGALVGEVVEAEDGPPVVLY